MVYVIKFVLPNDFSLESFQQEVENISGLAVTFVVEPGHIGVVENPLDEPLDFQIDREERHTLFVLRSYSHDWGYLTNTILWQLSKHGKPESLKLEFPAWIGISYADFKVRDDSQHG